MAVIQQIDDGRPDGCTFVGNIVSGPTIQNALTADGTTCYGLRVKSKVPTTLTCAGDQAGIYIETEITGTGTVSGSTFGLKIETYVESTATLTYDHCGAAIYTYSDIAGDQEIFCLRLEHNGASDLNAFLNLQSAAGARYLISSAATNDEWMSVTTTVTCGTAGGWYRVKHGGYTRYIQLYTSVS